MLESGKDGRTAASVKVLVEDKKPWVRLGVPLRNQDHKVSRSLSPTQFASHAAAIASSGAGG